MGLLTNCYDGECRTSIHDKNRMLNAECRKNHLSRLFSSFIKSQMHFIVKRIERIGNKMNKNRNVATHFIPI